MKNQTLTIYFDEAWRWPLAGPIFMWLICPIWKISKKELEPFCDSKMISEKHREELFWYIGKLQNNKKIIACASWMSAKEIDTYWMSNSLHLGIIRWIIQIIKTYNPNILQFNFDLPNPLSTKLEKSVNYSDILSFFINLENEWIHIKLIMDWNRDFWLKKMFPFWEIKTIISWDAKIKEIWMASIVAKVSRDRVMETLPKTYSKYNFSKHKWYWTKEHKQLIEKYWPSNIHRKLFLKRIYPNHSFEKKLPSSF
jgi:ribonuclease HII